MTTEDILFFDPETGNLEKISDTMDVLLEQDNF